MTSSEGDNNRFIEDGGLIAYVYPMPWWKLLCHCPLFSFITNTPSFSLHLSYPFMPINLLFFLSLMSFCLIFFLVLPAFPLSGQTLLQLTFQLLTDAGFPWSASIAMPLVLPWNYLLHLLQALPFQSSSPFPLTSLLVFITTKCFKLGSLEGHIFGSCKLGFHGKSNT